MSHKSKLLSSLEIVGAAPFGVLHGLSRSLGFCTTWSSEVFNAAGCGCILEETSFNPCLTLARLLLCAESGAGEGAEIGEGGEEPLSLRIEEDPAVARGETKLARSAARCFKYMSSLEKPHI
jgi:hypothetical protein